MAVIGDFLENKKTVNLLPTNVSLKILKYKTNDQLRIDLQWDNSGGTLVLPLVSFVTLVKSVNVFESQFSYFKVDL